MGVSFRTKLFVVVGVIALPFLVLILSTHFIDARVDTELVHIEQRYVPRIEAAPKLSASFDALGRSFQDAVAAHDVDALERCRAEKTAFFDTLAAAKGAFDPGEAE